MATTLKKIKRLEQYVAADNAAVDPVLDQALDKLLTRENANMMELKSRLEVQLNAFEKTYAMKSDEFYTKYNNGTLGDKTDFIKWASTVEMRESGWQY